MRIQANIAAFSETKWYEYAVRFIFGGLITAVAGLIAKSAGPVVGGLFLAFPAIFPASATLIEKHEKEKKQRKGLQGTVRAADVVSVEAAGTALGSLGLVVFALIVWKNIANHSMWAVLTGASLGWLIVSALLWELRTRL